MSVFYCDINFFIGQINNFFVYLNPMFKTRLNQSINFFWFYEKIYLNIYESYKMSPKCVNLNLLVFQKFDCTKSIIPCAKTHVLGCNTVVFSSIPSNDSQLLSYIYLYCWIFNFFRFTEIIEKHTYSIPIFNLKVNNL